MITTKRMMMGAVVAWLSLGFACPLRAQVERTPAALEAAMDHDLLEVTIPRLERMYREHKYTVTQVVDW